MSDTENHTRVRAAFFEQAEIVERMKSPITALVCHTFGARLNVDTHMGRAILNWAGDARVTADSVPLRLAGACHALVRRGHPLAALYPPHALPSSDALWAQLENILVNEQELLTRYLSSPPQTNEVMRSAVLMCGFLEISRQTGMPLSLIELGASAGLNQIPDLHYYQFGDASWGDLCAKIMMSPEWRGAPFPAANASLKIIARCGVDQAPIDLDSEDARERLMSYVWPDQRDRLDRLVSAIALSRDFGIKITAGDAAEWLEGFPASGENHQCRVIFHSIFWSYLPIATQTRLVAQIEKMAAHATHKAPLAWLRYEISASAQTHQDLRLKIWPGGEDRLLGYAHAHGAFIDWQAA
jgi:hypothetical protein